MEATSTKKYVRISRRKIARVGKECIGKKIKQVKAQLLFLPNESAREIFKVLKSAESNFINKNPNFNPDDLVVRDILVDKGPSFKRMIYRAKGRANRIEKKTSRLKVVLGEKMKQEKLKQKQEKVKQGISKRLPETTKGNENNEKKPKIVEK